MKAEINLSQKSKTGVPNLSMTLEGQYVYLRPNSIKLGARGGVIRDHSSQKSILR